MYVLYMWVYRASSKRIQIESITSKRVERKIWNAGNNHFKRWQERREKRKYRKCEANRKYKIKW